MGSSFACEHKNARVGALATFFHISPSFPFGFGPLACVFLCAVFMSTGSRVHKVHRGNGSCQRIGRKAHIHRRQDK